MGRQLVFEADDTGRRAAVDPATDLALEGRKVGWSLGATRTAEIGTLSARCRGHGLERHSPSARVVQAPVVRVLVPADESQSEDVLGDGANAVVGVALSCKPNKQGQRGILRRTSSKIT